jgi:hypothetical protein
MHRDLERFEDCKAACTTDVQCVAIGYDMSTTICAMYGHLRQRPPPGWVRMVETLNNGDHYAKVPRAKADESQFSWIFILIGPVGLTGALFSIFAFLFMRHWCKNRKKKMRKDVRNENRALEERMRELTDRHAAAEAKQDRGLRGGRLHRFSYGFGWNRQTEEEKEKQREEQERYEREGTPPKAPLRVRTSFLDKSKTRDEVSKFDGDQDEKKDDGATVEEI